jgi:AAA domain, putative AbiEii toxin, Type IV TA system
MFPQPIVARDSILLASRKQAPDGWKAIVRKSEANDYFNAENSGWKAPFRFGPQRLALANLPEDEERFPVAVWFRSFLSKGIQRLVLSGEAMRKPSPPGSPSEFQPDGSNLPWAIERLSRANPDRFNEWLDQVRTALPDIEAVETIERPEDKHRYLRIQYRTGLKAPSWTVSDGTLRLLALTLVSYLDVGDRIYLIEEPENGIHPRAVETVFQALASTNDSQILCATHSPIMLSLAQPEAILCFARTDDGTTDIVRGNEHPNLRAWKHRTDLGTLFATGVLG